MMMRYEPWMGGYRRNRRAGLRLIHGIGANRLDNVRRVNVTGINLGWLKPYEDRWFAYSRYIMIYYEPDLAERAYYTQHRPNTAHRDGQRLSTFLHEIVQVFHRAIDALRSSQQDAVLKFVTGKHFTP
ncbi:hypothetical protein AB1K62_14215 [Parasphingorhabdus sp. JC815]|uniref:hypothetical protein n=1 Tax=Parasphingorhabdus sp. JC815 TaxID=3232140 RepID=UPI00345A3BCB